MDRRNFAWVVLIWPLLAVPAAVQGRSLESLPTFGSPTLGAAVRDSDTIAVCRLSCDDPNSHVIRFEAIRILKGNGQLAEAPRYTFQVSRMWMSISGQKVGDREAIVLIKGLTAAIYYDSCWHEIFFHPRGLCWMSNYNGNMLQSIYAGSAAGLIENVGDILAGREVVIVAVKPKFRDSIDNGPDRDMESVWRIKASLKIDVAPQTIRSPSYVGWGAGDPSDLPQMIARLHRPQQWMRCFAIRDVLSLGERAKAALPVLWEQLADPEPHIRILAAMAALQIDPADDLPMLAIAFELRNQDGYIRNEAANSLGWLGARALPFLPRLLDQFEEEQSPVSIPLVEALGQLGAHADPEMKRSIAAVIARKMRHSVADDDRFRESALHTLRKLAPFIEPAFSTLKLMGHNSTEAAELLARYAPDGPEWLMRTVERSKRGSAAIEALGNLGLKGVPGIPPLRKRLTDENLLIRIRAASALMQIDPRGEADRALPVLIDLASDRTDGAVSRLAQNFLQTLGVRGPNFATTAEGRRFARYLLMNVIRDADASGRDAAIEELKAQGIEARDTAPELWRLLKADESSSQAALISALWKIDAPIEAGGLRRDSRAELIAQLKIFFREQKDERLAFLDTVAGIGAGAAPLAGEVRQCLDDPQLSGRALYSLRQIGPAAGKAVIPDLIRLTDADNPYIQQAAILAFCRVGRGHAHGVQRLREWCDTEGLSILEQIEPADLGTEKITSILHRAIRSDDEHLAEHARKLLQATETNWPMRMMRTEAMR